MAYKQIPQQINSIGIQTAMISFLDILLKLEYMINPEIPTNKCVEMNLSQCYANIEDLSKSKKNYLSFSEQDFENWCSLMTIDQLETCFRIYYPSAANFLRKSNQENNKNLFFVFPESLHLDTAMRNLAINTYKKFIQAILFLSSKDYLDTITFNSDCFLFPNKVYKLLQNTKLLSILLTPNPSEPELEVASSLKQKQGQWQQQTPKIFEVMGEIVDKIQKNLEEKMKLKLLYKEKQQIETNENQDISYNIIPEFNMYWKYCSEEEKLSVWMLGYHDVKKAASKLIDAQYKLDLYQIQQYVYLLQKIGVKELPDRMFSWRLGRNDHGITDYLRLIFRQLKKRTQKQALLYSPKQKSKLQKRKKTRYLRHQSLSESSNQTNQTDLSSPQTQPLCNINVDDVVSQFIENDVVNIADQLNQSANIYYQNRILAYQRLKDILSMLGAGLQLKVYGSVCVGLAVKDSDVDVTIGESILDNWGYLPDISDRISAFFQYLQCYFNNYPWISNLKVIKSATIPIIKFTIDTQQPYSSLTLPPSNPPLYLCPVQIDLTLQTTQPPRKHLGIVSTKQTQQWLNEIACLQMVTIILKNQLALIKLNETYYGGLNTYTLIVMIVALCRKENIQKEEKVGVVLQRVLQFYGCEFQEDQYRIDLTCQHIFYKKDQDVDLHKQNQAQNSRKLQVKDPLCPQRVITRNCYKFKQIKNLFKQLHKKYYIDRKKQIEEICSTWNPKQNKYDQNKLIEWVNKNLENKNKMQQMGEIIEKQERVEMILIQEKQEREDKEEIGDRVRQKIE